MRLTIPAVDQHELEQIAQVLASGYLTQGPKVAEFEQLVAHYVGSRYAFATSSATTALHLSLVALGISEGDEVLVGDFTFPASGNVVVQQGAAPVLVDIELSTFTMDIDDLRAKITPRTKAIMPIHAFGCSADMISISEIAQAHQLAIIEDAACAIGATYRGQACGTLGDLGCYSFHPRKVITTGEGGMIVTDDDVLADKIRILRTHGGVSNGLYSKYAMAGFNYRLSDILGAVGIAQMAKLPGLLEQRKQLASIYQSLLQDLELLHVPSDPDWGGHIYQSFVVLLDEEIDRDTIIQSMHAEGIETTLGTYALHMQPFYQQQFGYQNGDCPNSRIAFNHSLTLPLYPGMSLHDPEIVVQALSNSLDTTRQQKFHPIP